MTDLRYSLRAFRRNPAFSLTAIAVIALGVGATTAVFSFVDRILFRPLPYRDASRLVSVGMTVPWVPGGEFVFGPSYLFLHDAPEFEQVTSWTGIADCDLTENNPVRLACAKVESTFLSLAGFTPIVGLDFIPGADQAFISYGLWHSRFGGDPAIAGRTISLDQRPVRIAGVLPREFEMPSLAHADILLPQAFDRAAFERNVSGTPIRVLARIKPGETPLQMETALLPRFQQTLLAVPPEVRKTLKLRVRSLRDWQIQDVRLASWLLFGSVLAVLLIACANVANLLLVRGVGRQREISIRMALGASQFRLIRQCLTESVTLAVVGAGLGVLMARLVLVSIVALAPVSIPRLREATLDTRVLVFALALSLAAGIVFGLGPAFHRATSRALFRHLLVSAQVAVSLVLLTAAGFLLRTFWTLQNASLGMRPESVLTMSLSLGRRFPQPADRLRFFEEIENRLARLPGVKVAVSDSLPPVTPARSKPLSAIQVDGRPPASLGPGIVVWRSVTPDYFAALGIPILRGRAFREEDRRPGEHSMILSESLGRRLFPDEDPVNQHVRSGDLFTVIGVAGDVRNELARDDPEYYVARTRSASDAIYSAPDALQRGSITVRSAIVQPETLRAEIAAIDKTLPVTIETMPGRVANLADRPKFNAVLLSLFAAIGVLLAAIGLYGVVSFLVAQRTREIGVRIALGATPGSVARLVLGNAARWTFAGAAAGVAISLAVKNLLGSMLYGVSGNDSWMLAAPLAVLLPVATGAAWFPARRAAKVDPSDALRHE